MDAIAEVRFQSDIQPAVLPGVVYAAVRDRFSTMQELPVAQIPEFARNEAMFRYQPTVVFQGEVFTLNVGPRVFFVNCKPGNYPGWQAYQELLSWLFSRFQQSSIIRTPERLGLRYVDFFRLPVIGKLQIEVLLGGHSLLAGALHLRSQLRRGEYACLLQVDTSAVVQKGGKPEPGAVLDLDVGFSIPTDQFFQRAVAAFDGAHLLQKRLFFGELLHPDFLATLNPVYD